MAAGPPRGVPGRVLAGLAAAPVDPVEAAVVDGATDWQVLALATAFLYFRMGTAAALLVLFFVIVLGVTAGLARVRQSEWAG